MAEYISREELLKHLNNCRLDPLFDPDMARICFAISVFVENMQTADVQPVKRGQWITKSEDYYKAWQDSGRSWDDMPYFVTGLKFACSNCFEQYDVNAEGVEKWNGCPLCLARMDGEYNE